MVANWKYLLQRYLFLNSQRCSLSWSQRTEWVRLLIMFVPTHAHTALPSAGTQWWIYLHHLIKISVSTSHWSIAQLLQLLSGPDWFIIYSKKKYQTNWICRHSADWRQVTVHLYVNPPYVARQHEGQQLCVCGVCTDRSAFWLVVWTTSFWPFVPRSLKAQRVIFLSVYNHLPRLTFTYVRRNMLFTLWGFTALFWTYFLCYINATEGRLPSSTMESLPCFSLNHAFNTLIMAFWTYNFKASIF